MSNERQPVGQGVPVRVSEDTTRNHIPRQTDIKEKAIRPYYVVKIKRRDTRHIAKTLGQRS